MFMSFSGSISFQDSLILYLVFRGLDDSGLSESACKLISQELIATQTFKPNQLIFHYPIDEYAKGWQCSNAQFLDEKWRFGSIQVEELSIRELMAQNFQVFMHYFASFKLFMIEMDNSELQFCDIVQELILRNLSILPNASFLFYLSDWSFLSHSKSFPLHLPHNFPGFLIVKLIKFIPLCIPSLSFFLFPLLLLLHDNFVTDNFLHDDVIENVPQECVLHLFEFFIIPVLQLFEFIPTNYSRIKSDQQQIHIISEN